MFRPLLLVCSFLFFASVNGSVSNSSSCELTTDCHACVSQTDSGGAPQCYYCPQSTSCIDRRSKGNSCDRSTLVANADKCPIAQPRVINMGKFGRTPCSPIIDCHLCVSKTDSSGASQCYYCPQSASCIDRSSTNHNSCNNSTRVSDADKCPIGRSQPRGTAYSDNFGRRKVQPLCGAAYAEDPQFLKDCLATHGFVAYAAYRVPCTGLKESTCFAYTARSDYDRAIIVAFRGSESIVQIVHQALNMQYVEFLGGYVAKYFQYAFVDLLNVGMLDDLYDLRSQYLNYELWTVGHSLGGALASLLSTFVVDQGIYDGRRVTLVTLGQPRVGDQEYADYHDSLVLISRYTSYCLTGALLLPRCA